MVKILRITNTDPLYAQAVALREQVLLNPIGMDIDGYRRHAPGVEERAEHFIAILDHPTGPRVIGSAGLLVDRDDGARRAKVIQMAVDPQRQGEGIGRRLLAAVEARAIGELGLSGLFCHAQMAAVGFYQRQGWLVVSEEFEEAGIPHRVMSLAGSPKPAAEAHHSGPGPGPARPSGPQPLTPQ